ncbi:MAG: hypothetical protein XD82_1308 [Methanoculleus marisnigri]|uniref:Uncharacterized protein n=1 Tax=Methanoculleus marisnigri TaxID=2198 RepID=A0A124FS40_9EURY|nr:MAG: hypothetical protein XD82_1308 [Methanoculleus marisnigri]
MRRPEAGRGGGYTSTCEMETGEGETPSHLTVLKLATLALPVGPTPRGDIPTVHLQAVMPGDRLPSPANSRNGPAGTHKYEPGSPPRR